MRKVPFILWMDKIHLAPLKTSWETIVGVYRGSYIILGFLNDGAKLRGFRNHPQYLGVFFFQSSEYQADCSQLRVTQGSLSPLVLAKDFGFLPSTAEGRRASEGRAVTLASGRLTRTSAAQGSLAKKMCASCAL